MMRKKLLQFFSSVKLTVWCLALGMILVFVGTLAQVEQGLYLAQDRYFKSLFVFWSPVGANWQIPVFPGGYLIGGVLVINLIVSYARRYPFKLKNSGLLMIHGGLVLLLVGQLLTDVLSVESAMRMEHGETKSYSEDFHAIELVLIDTSNPDRDRVVSVPGSWLRPDATFDLPATPFRMRVKDFWVNADILNTSAHGALPSGANQGAGNGRYVLPLAPTYKMNERNLPAATVELSHNGGSVGSWLVSHLLLPQPVEHEGRSFRIALRPKRHYKPFSLTLLDLRHDVYQGTQIPKNFSSRVRILNPGTGEDREVLIYMNNPLRYSGLTFYQYQMAAEGPVRASTLQVVRNPGWITPYLACLLVGFGMTLHFVIHLMAFLRKRRS
jgi:hypothetical protein